MSNSIVDIDEDTDGDDGDDGIDDTFVVPDDEEESSDSSYDGGDDGSDDGEAIEAKDVLSDADDEKDAPTHKRKSLLNELEDQWHDSDSVAAKKRSREFKELAYDDDDDDDDDGEQLDEDLDESEQLKQLIYSFLDGTNHVNFMGYFYDNYLNTLYRFDQDSNTMMEAVRAVALNGDWTLRASVATGSTNGRRRLRCMFCVTTKPTCYDVVSRTNRVIGAVGSTCGARFNVLRLAYAILKQMTRFDSNSTDDIRRCSEVIYERMCVLRKYYRDFIDLGQRRETMPIFNVNIGDDGDDGNGKAIEAEDVSSDADDADNEKDAATRKRKSPSDEEQSRAASMSRLDEILRLRAVGAVDSK